MLCDEKYVIVLCDGRCAECCVMGGMCRECCVSGGV